MAFGIYRWHQLRSRAEWLVSRRAPCHENIEYEISCHTAKEHGSLVRADVDRPFEERRVDACAKIHCRPPGVVDRGTVRDPEIRPRRAERTGSVRGKVQREPVERD